MDPRIPDRQSDWTTAEVSVTVQFERSAQAAEVIPGPSLEIEVLAADTGQVLLLTCGQPDHPVRILIDCGPPSTYRELERRLSDLPPQQRRIDLLVLTHVDEDRIGAAIPLLERGSIDIEFGDIWFNGSPQLDV